MFFSPACKALPRVRHRIPSLGAHLGGAFLLATTSWALSPPTWSQTVRLNEPFVYESVVGKVHDFILKPNGNFLFYRADARRAGVIELFTVRAVGGMPPFRENLKFLPDRSVLDYQPTAIGSWIVFQADQDENDVFELYSRRPGDSAPRQLNGQLVLGGDVMSFALSPDGTRVVYCADQDVDELFELYVAAIDGSGSPVKISGTMVVGGDVRTFPAFLVSPTSSRVVYLADSSTDEVYELFSAPLDGSAAPVRLNAPLVPGGNVASGGALFWDPPPMAITSDGATVVYKADQDANEVYELFRVPIDGSASPIQIHPALVSGGDVDAFQLSPDAERVVYTADQDTNNQSETYSAPLDGSSPAVKLNAPGQPASLVAISPDSSWVVLQGGVILLQSAPIDGSTGPIVLEDLSFTARELRDAAISPDSSRVAYRTGYTACSGSCFFYETLRSVPLDGSASPVRLDEVGGQLGTIETWRPQTPFAFSADSSRVVFRWGESEQLGLYSAPSDGSEPALALTTLEVGPVFAAGPVGSRAFFLADATDTDVFELHSVSLVDGTGLVKLSGSLARDTFADVDMLATSEPAFRIDAQGERVVFCADPVVDQGFELFTVPADGHAVAVPLSGDRTVSHFQLSPSGERVVYVLDPGSPASGGELFSLPANGGANPSKLNHVLPGGQRVIEFGISADGSSVAYSAGAYPAFVAGLFSVPTEGGTPLQVTGANITNLAFSPTENRVVFLQSEVGGHSLQSALLDGSEPPVKLHGTVSGGHVPYFSPDGTHVVYSPWPRVQLLVVPADGSADPLLLTGTISISSAPVFTPDGDWIVFAGRLAATPDVVELFKAPIDGTLAPVKLNGPLVAGGDVFTLFSSTVLVSPDSSRVVYVADQETDGVLELYSVPLDGSASPIKLNGPLVAGGDVTVGVSFGYGAVAISPNGERVVYVADQETDEVLELYSVPLDGSASPVKLSGPMSPDGDLAAAFDTNPYPERAFRITPDSTRVVYAADQESDRLFELFLAPIDGSLAPLKLNWQLAQNGVTTFEISADSRRVVYQATERSEVTELFESVLTFDRHRRHLASPEEGRKP